MSLTSDERDRFLASLRSDAAFRDEVRREVLSSELLELPERFAAFVEEMHSFVEETGRRFEALERQVDRLTYDSGELRGMVLEQKIRQDPGCYLTGLARKVKVVGFDDLMDQLGIDDLSDSEHAALGRTDVLATGRATASGASAVYVIEATWRAHTGDVDRQVLRRQILADRLSGTEVIALIASIEEPAGAVRDHAAEKSVVVVSAGRADAA